MLCSLFCLHMINWQCTPCFDSTRSGSEQSGLALHKQISENHIYLGTKFKQKTSSCIQVNMLTFIIIITTTTTTTITTTTSFSCAEIQTGWWKTQSYNFTFCFVWPITLRKEHKLREFENRMLRRIFVAKREEVTRNFIIYNVSTIRVTKSMRKIDETCNTHREWKIHGPFWHRWADNIKADLKHGIKLGRNIK